MIRPLLDGKRLHPGPVIALVILLFLGYSGQDRPDQLNQVKQRGELTMLTRNGASTYYIGPDGPTGLEVELVRGFAEYLGVELNIVSAQSFRELPELLEAGAGDLIAANLSRTPEREERFNFGPDYQHSSILVLYRRGQARPRRFADLVGLKLMVIADSSYEETLDLARMDLPELSWEPRDDVGMEELLLAVSDGAIDATLVDSTIYELNGHFYPRVSVGFELPGLSGQAWAFPGGEDRSLAEAAQRYFRELEESGSLQPLLDAFYGAEARMDRVGMHTFTRQLRRRLPPLVPIFRETAEAYGLDWRLLAAISYQESHWDPNASSYTGVRGLMMLTLKTANQLGVKDRLDPRQSVDGGARYLVNLRERIPERIPEPDRTWMALAAYNMGMGHLEDVRVLTQRQGGDADSWEDVSQRLELITQERYYRDTRYGYARGHEARQFVANVRSYYDTLVWMDTREHPLLATGTAP
jgi:membrane-bound lytic murein transglycosylase F